MERAEAGVRLVPGVEVVWMYDIAIPDAVVETDEMLIPLCRPSPIECGKGGGIIEPLPSVGRETRRVS
jgi:hypothetical protein